MLHGFDPETPVIENYLRENNNLNKDLPAFFASLLLTTKSGNSLHFQK